MLSIFSSSLTCLNWKGCLKSFLWRNQLVGLQLLSAGDHMRSWSGCCESDSDVMELVVENVYATDKQRLFLMPQRGDMHVTESTSPTPASVVTFTLWEDWSLWLLLTKEWNSVVASMTAEKMVTVTRDLYLDSLNFHCWSVCSHIHVAPEHLWTVSWRKEWNVSSGTALKCSARGASESRSVSSRWSSLGALSSCPGWDPTDYTLCRCC